MKKKIIKALKDGNLFDWLYNHAHELDNDDLACIARELALSVQVARELGETQAFKAAMLGIHDNFLDDDE